MSLYIVSRRKIVFHQSSLGSVQVIYVPTTDQIQVMKDAAGTTVTLPNKANAGMVARGPQLARVQRGIRTLYGTLPHEILELRQSVQVWLAEDLAPPEADAFFYVFSAQVVVHGIRERNEEGRLVWRTAQLQLPPADGALPALQVILADYSLANPGQNVCLAVANDVALFRTVQQGEHAHGYQAIPFSTLRPSSEVAPLYKHGNFTLLYLALIVLSFLMVLGVGFYWMSELAKNRQLVRDIDAVEAQIRAVQINKRTGHIRQPDAVLRELIAGVAVSPSSLVQAAADVGVRFGTIKQIALAQATSLDSEAGVALGPESQLMQVLVDGPYHELLVEQAAAATETLKTMPWVSRIIRQGQVGGMQLELAVVLNVTGTMALGPAPAMTSETMAASPTVAPTSGTAPNAKVSPTEMPQ